MAERRKPHDVRQDEGRDLPPNSIVFKWRIAVVTFLALNVLIWILFATLESDPWHILD